MTNTLVVEKEKVKAPLQLHILGDKVLRQNAKRIAKIDESVKELAVKMLQTMYAENGIGLAAPQVGVNKQMIVVDLQPDNENYPPLVMINPVIKKYSKEVCVLEEGCLSIPNVFLDVTRPSKIEVEFKNLSGKKQRIKASGWMARVIQHEMDHLTGILFVDRIKNNLALTQELTKQGLNVNAVRSIS
ncbi:peptide deformylase [Cyanobacterium stanieri LEGE 03274]|uniref:Peptide deformylase n=1 Tax=Cyanobacterium stanieri LEGE 03274 TaxID=1828756 RepID=A0ABR9V2P6_9CHRO|nr:peptide deformylase [Cyanobacterium stanieri]MBE9222177.1 peptide deformylase [Cyanobacterium stanieri LEGE 03274]